MEYAPFIDTALKESKSLSKARITLGKEGEDLAAKYLQQQGLSIVMRNYRQKTGEIDIIARDGDCLVFVEVKTRTSVLYGMPYEAVTPRKQAQISKTALDYLTRNKLTDQAARFDIISILMNKNGKAEIEHLPNCFDFCCSK